MDVSMLTGNPASVGAAEALRHSPIPALRRLTLEETPTHVVLTGRLPSYYFKQMAQETILPFLEGRELMNRVVVHAK